MKVIDELKRYTSLTESRAELNRQIATQFNVAEQKLMLDSVRKMLTIEFFHVLSLMKTEREIREQIRSGMRSDV